MKRQVMVLLTLSLLLAATACGNSAAEGGADCAPQGQKTEMTAGTPEQSQEETAPEGEGDTETETEMEETGAERQRTAVYQYESVYLSVGIPEGWDYRIKTVDDMGEEDDLAVCAIDFWNVEFPEAVFSLEYESGPFGICGTGVTTEEFASENGIIGDMYTEAIEDTLWLTCFFRNPSAGEEGGSYVIMASPDLSVWETIEPEFMEIRDSVWVGNPPSQTRE